MAAEAAQKPTGSHVSENSPAANRYAGLPSARDCHAR